MQFHVTRSGGFAGLRAEATIDTETLDEPVRSSVEQALAPDRLLQATTETATASGADRFQYAITVAGGPTYRLHEASLPRAARAVFRDALAGGSRQQPRD